MLALIHPTPSFLRRADGQSQKHNPSVTMENLGEYFCIENLSETIRPPMNVLVFYRAYLWAFVVTFLLVTVHCALPAVPLLPCTRFSFGLT